MEHTTPMLFTALCFIVAIPIMLLMTLWIEKNYLASNWLAIFKYSILPATVLTVSAFMVQYALVTATASKAGLISNSYVCIVPFIAVLFDYKLKAMELLAALFAFIGIYFLTVTSSDTIAFSIEVADIILIFSAVGWAVYILLLDYSLKYIKPFSFALVQTIICAVQMSIAVPFIEMASLQMMLEDFPSFARNLWVEIIFLGLISIGIAFGLQLLAQKYISPSRVSILYSTESLFVVLFGWLLLGEVFSLRELIGAALMLFALIVVRARLNPQEEK